MQKQDRSHVEGRKWTHFSESKTEFGVGNILIN